MSIRVGRDDPTDDERPGHRATGRRGRTLASRAVTNFHLVHPAWVAGIGRTFEHPREADVDQRSVVELRNPTDSRRGGYRGFRV